MYGKLNIFLSAKYLFTSTELRESFENAEVQLCSENAKIFLLQSHPFHENIMKTCKLSEAIVCLKIEWLIWEQKKNVDFFRNLLRYVIMFHHAILFKFN